MQAFKDQTTNQPATDAGIHTVAFLVSDLSLGLHRHMLILLKQACAQRGQRLLVFEGKALDIPDLHARCYNSIYRMLSEERVDGLVVASSELGAHVGPEGMARFLERFTLPTVVIGTPIRGISCFSSDDTASVKLVLDHLARHRKRRIVWVSGPVSDPHSLIRLFAFRDGIARINPQFDEREDILQGNDTIKGGFDMMARLHPRIGTSVDAICFSNDEMAIGAIDYCTLHGIRVPEEIVMTGIDDIDMSELVNPGLTTVRHNIRGMISAALTQLDTLAVVRDAMDPEPDPIRSMFSPTLQVRGSCGCDTPELSSRNPFLDTVVHHGPFVGESIQTFSTEELFDQLEHFLKERQLRFSFILAYEDLPEGISCHHFEPPRFSRMLHGFLDGQRIYDNEPFRTAMLVPDTIWEKLSQEPILIKPLFYQNEVFGYVVAPADESQRAAINDLRLMVSLTMKGEKLIQERENAQKRVEWALDAMRSVNSRLSDISLRDELTGLYNRRGFIQEATRHLRANPASFLLVFLDMNGLKAINDLHGHDDGDLALKTTAEILRHCFRDRDILARIGGDEFAALVKDVGEEQIERLEERFASRSRQASMDLGKSYQISFARGYVQGDASSDLDAMMNEADQRMYQHKKQMKQE